jgi:hypothetical protein
MDPLASNPFTVFTFIAAPAVMTNAAAVMSLTASNRIARAVDRSRALVVELAKAGAVAEDIRPFRIREVGVAHDRAVLLNRALAAFQFAFGFFAAASILALVGATFGHFQLTYLMYGNVLVALVSMALAVGGVVRGAYLLVRESQMAYRVLREETAYIMHGLVLPPSPDL